MARIRTIKPEFPQSESMGNVSRDARLCFVLMWTLADDSGRLRGNSRMLASLLFPYDNDAPGLMDSWIAELESEGCVLRYEVGGSTYIQIAKWLSHQKIDKPSSSKIPAFDESSRILANPRGGIKDQGSKDQGPKEGKRAPRPQAVACSPSPEKSPKPAKPAAVDASLLIEAGFSPEVAAEFISHKASQKAPLTPRAWSDHVAEARKAGWTPQQAAEKVMAKGWKGFEAKYVQNEARPNAPAQAAAPIVSPAIEKTRELLASHELPPEQIEANRQRAAELRAQLNLRAVA